MKLEKLFKEPIFKLLNFLFRHTSQEFYEKQLAEESGISVGACNKYVKKLVDLSILDKEEKGKMNFYRLNREGLLVKHLKILFTLSSSLVEEIRGIDKGETYLFGSFARGEDREESDLDLLVIGNRSQQKEISALLRKLESKYGKEISINSFTREEWIKMKKKDPAFYERVEKDKIRLS